MDYGDAAPSCVLLSTTHCFCHRGQPTPTHAHNTQGLPLGSGLGSSAASAAAAAWAVNGLFGCPLSKDELVVAGLASEAAVSGYHADNVGPSLLGGFVLVRWVRGEAGRGVRESLWVDDRKSHFAKKKPRREKYKPTRHTQSTHPPNVQEL